MLREYVFVWSEWDALRIVNVVLCTAIVVMLIVRARRWITAEPADRVLMLGLGWFGISTAWGAIEASLQGVHGGSRIASYTLAATLSLAGIVIPRKKTMTMTPTPISTDADAPRRVGAVAKFLVPAVIALLILLKPIFSPEGLDLTIFTVLTVLIAIGNAPVIYYLGGTRAKTIGQAVSAGLLVIIAGIDSASQWIDLGRVSYDTWVAALLAIAGIFGVALIPNAPSVVPVEPVTPMVPVEAPGGQMDVEDALDRQERVSQAAQERRDGHHSGTISIGE